MRAAGGVLEGSKMALTFNMLRANDLIWSFVVNNYLLGKEPVPFDLLYWNSDTTRMPLKLHLAYLRQCYRDNALAKAQMILGGERLNIAKIKTPAFFQAAKEDHIAPGGIGLQGREIVRRAGNVSCSRARAISPASSMRLRPGNISIGPMMRCRPRLPNGRQARWSIPAPGGPIGMPGSHPVRARKSRRPNPATAS